MAATAFFATYWDLNDKLDNNANTNSESSLSKMIMLKQSWVLQSTKSFECQYRLELLFSRLELTANNRQLEAADYSIWLKI
jgi:hypothetical protein